MNTFHQLWGVRTPAEAKAKIQEQIARMHITHPKNLEEQALALVGQDVYEKLVEGYTRKQWGRECKDLPAFIIKRLPLRYTYDNNYFKDPYQGIPKGGYTRIVKKLLEGVQVCLNTDFFANREELTAQADKVLFTGMIDEFYDYCYGTWDFKWTLGAVNLPTTLEVNRKCNFGGYEITVKKMEVTPLLWSLYLDYDEAMKVYEDEKNKFEYTGTDYGMDLYGRANIDQVRYKDGTVLTLDLTMGGIAGGGEKQDKENGVLIIRNSFPQLVDVDNLQAVHFGNIDQWLEVRG